MSNRSRILIADDHPLFRNGMSTLLKAASDMEVVGVATNGDEAIALAASLQPDVILMDIHIQGAIDGCRARRKKILNIERIASRRRRGQARIF